ncbi:MAG TPA: hypothetical protein VLY03_12355 [Bacteroidota bacterium]|nr:hypothetical protein [Bacteroidota bacterium]
MKPVTNQDSSAQALDPLERYVPLLFKIAVYVLLTLVFYQAETTFIQYHPGQYWPGFLAVLRSLIFLPLHEGGHFLFMFFGRTLYILGGSFWQIMFPFLWFLIALRQRSEVAPFALFWMGENMMDVSLYIRDAAYRALPLLGGDSSGHDWFNLLSSWHAVPMADDIADIVYYLGFIISAGSIVAGFLLAFIRFFKSASKVPVVVPSGSVSREKLELEEKLNEALRTKKEEGNVANKQGL